MTENTFRCTRDYEVFVHLAHWLSHRFPHLQLEEHVMCFQTTLETDVIHIDMKTFNPYTSVITLFYVWDTKVLRVLGATRACDVFMLGGKIDLTLNVLMRGEDAPLWTNQSVTPAEKTKEWFWIPILDIPRSPSESFKQDASFSVFDAVVDRITWYLSNGNHHRPPMGCVGGTPAQELCVLLFTSIVAAALEHSAAGGGKHHAAYQEVRMRLERQRLSDLFNQYVSTEDDIMELLVHNGLRDYMIQGMVVDATPLDKQCFFLRTPLGKYAPPTIVFQALAEDVSPELAKTLPLYNGGLVHLTHVDFFEWVWHVFETEHMRMISRTTEIKDERILAQAQRVHAYFELYGSSVFLRNSHNDGNMKRKRPTIDDGVFLAHKTADEQQQFLLSLMPPCFHSVMTQKSFMKNNQRWPWIITLREAGIPKHEATQWLERMNARDPHKSYTTLKSRVDVDTLWEYRAGDECKCGNIVRNTLTLPRETSIHCPFVNKESKASVKDIEDILDDCKPQCAKAMGATRRFGGPADLISQALFKATKK